MKKPPLGLPPRRLHEHARIIAILEAMKRYRDEGVGVPQEWIDELLERFERYGL